MVIDHDDAVLDAVAAALGCAGRTELAARVVRLLARRGDTLLVLDNAEHALCGAVELVGTLRAGCPELVVLLTSRCPTCSGW